MKEKKITPNSRIDFGLPDVFRLYGFISAIALFFSAICLARAANAKRCARIRRGKKAHVRERYTAERKSRTRLLYRKVRKYITMCSVFVSLITAKRKISGKNCEKCILSQKYS